MLLPESWQLFISQIRQSQVQSAVPNQWVGKSNKSRIYHSCYWNSLQKLSSQQFISDPIFLSDHDWVVHPIRRTQTRSWETYCRQARNGKLRRTLEWQTTYKNLRGFKRIHGGWSRTIAGAHSRNSESRRSPFWTATHFSAAGTVDQSPSNNYRHCRVTRRCSASQLSPADVKFHTVQFTKPGIYVLSVYFTLEHLLPNEWFVCVILYWVCTFTVGDRFS